MTPSTPLDPSLRSLGAMERVYHLFSAKHPMHFSVVAELGQPVPTERLHAALAALADRHPTLTATVDVSELGIAVFHGQDVPIPVRTVAEQTWQSIVAEELATPLPVVGAGASARVTLLEDPPTLVLTFAHHIADGTSAVRVLDNLLRLLNGQSLEPGTVPAARESHFTAVPAVQDVIAQGPPTAPPPVVDERMRTPPEYLSWRDATRAPYVDARALDAETTRSLLRRAREENTTVHGAVLAATALEQATARDARFARLMSPVRLDELIGRPDGTGVYIHAVRSAVEVDPRTDFWALAREHMRQIAPARSNVAIGRAAAAFISAAGEEATSDSAAAFMGRGALGLDALVSNLGVVDLAEHGPVTVRDFWGPFVLMQVKGETGISVSTHLGRLHVTEVTHDDTRIVNGIAQRLTVAALS